MFTFRLKGREFNTLQVIKNLAYYVLRICLISSAPGYYLLRVTAGLEYFIVVVQTFPATRELSEAKQGPLLSGKNGHR